MTRQPWQESKRQRAARLRAAKRRWAIEDRLRGKTEIIYKVGQKPVKWRKGPDRDWIFFGTVLGLVLLVLASMTA